MEYRRINPHPSPFLPSLLHTHTPTHSRWTPGPSPETIQPLWSHCAFIGIHLQSHWAPCAFTRMHPQTNPQSKYPSQPFSPIPGSMFHTIFLTRGSTVQCVCSPVARFNPLEILLPCGLPVSCCLATSVVRSRNS